MRRFPFKHWSFHLSQSINQDSIVIHPKRCVEDIAHLHFTGNPATEWFFAFLNIFKIALTNKIRMKVHPIRANPRTTKPVIWNESESSLNEFAFSAIALDDAKQVMENSNKTNV